jgi:predicted TIM-barrel fold metal-dependent hydrolase
MFTTSALCGDLGVPLQIHVGMGDSPSSDLRKSNPILLYDFINDEASKKTKIIFTHTGYPYIEEAGFLANQYPNVFLDISEMTPFISYGIKDKLLRLLEMCPTNKLLYGSDGHNIPELFWISSLETRYSIHELIQHFASKKTVEDKWLNRIPHQILFENAKRVYNIDF